MLRVISKDSTKPIYTALFSDGKNVVCTDSRRLHCAEMGEFIPSGLYRVVKNSTSEIVLDDKSAPEGTFPDYRQVLTERENWKDLSDWHRHTNGASTIYSIMSQRIKVNPGFVEDACKDHFHLQISLRADAFDPIQIRGDLGIAIIMPIQKKEIE